MENPFAKLKITPEQMAEFLDTCYKKVLNGIPSSKSCYELANDYLEKYKDRDVAVKKFISFQIAKCSTSGFVTGLGGIITLPVTLPANIASVLYIQLRMIATIAIIGGYDAKRDEVQTLAYLCLINASIINICKKAGIAVANKTTTALLKKLPSAVLIKINQKVGFRLLTKFGEKGAINLVKLIPVAGGLVSAGFDFAGTKIVAAKSYKTFILDNIDDYVEDNFMDVEFDDSTVISEEFIYVDFEAV
ncbi:hypothetical protein FACS1894132_11190 [Clostridia bacterium]|nr:hypothetical protein FACS1894132_11190 [Clostridia bacterium]